jgi:hypothetical protein
LLALVIYVKLLKQLYWYEGNNPAAVEIRDNLKEGLLRLILFYTFFLSQNQVASVVNLVVLFFFYYLGKKIYIRIIKKANFIDESSDQKYQTRLDNRILLFFPL